MRLKTNAVKLIRPSSFDEYAEWFFARAVRTGALDPRKLPQSPSERLATFHSPVANGKYHDWFPQASWTIQLLELQADLERLMVVSAPFTRKYQLWNPPEQRLLGIEARNALTNDYFGRDPTSSKHQRYYEMLRTSEMKLEGEDRLVLISLSNASKREAPDATYYLHDGFGRSLPYMMLLLEGKVPFSPVEVFLGVNAGDSA